MTTMSPGRRSGTKTCSTWQGTRLDIGCTLITYFSLVSEIKEQILPHAVDEDFFRCAGSSPPQGKRYSDTADMIKKAQRARN